MFYINIWCNFDNLPYLWDDTVTMKSLCYKVEIMVFKCFTKTWQAVLFDRITELFYISNSWVPCSNVHIQLWSLRKDFHWYLQFCFNFPCKTFSWISKKRFFFKYCHLIEVLFFVNLEIIIHQTEKCDLVQEMTFYIT